MDANELHTALSNAIIFRSEYLRFRRGQAWFNALHELRPDLANEIRGTDIDPFYNDNKLPDAWEWLDKKTRP